MFYKDHQERMMVGACNAHKVSGYTVSLSGGYTIFRTTKWQICSSDHRKKFIKPINGLNMEYYWEYQSFH